MGNVREIVKQYQGFRREIYIIFIAKIINAIGCFVFPLLALILTDRIGLSKADAGKLMSIFGVLFIPASIVGGKLSDWLGRKIVILCCDFLAIVFYFICGFVEPSMIQVYFIMTAAFFMFMSDPAHSSMLADLTTPEDRERAYSLTYMGWNLGFAVGPVLGGLLYRNHLRWVFIGDALTAFIAFILIAVFIKETIHHSKDTSKLSEMETHHDGSIWSVFKLRPVIAGLAIVSIAYSFAYGQWGFIMPLHSIAKNPILGAQYYGYMAGFNGLIVILFTPLLTKVLNQSEAFWKIILGGVLYTVGFGILGILNPYWMFFVSVFIFTLGEIVLAITLMPYIMNQTPANHRGRMNAMLPIVMHSGHAFGPMIMGYFLEGHSLEQGWFLTGSLALVGVCLMIAIQSKVKKQDSILEKVSI